MTLITYEEWRNLNHNCLGDPDIEDFLNTISFKGFMSSPVALDESQTPIAAKSRIAHQLLDFFNFNFSECYLYKIEKRNYYHYFLPDGTLPEDYNINELNNFKKEIRHAYKIRYAGEETIDD